MDTIDPAIRELPFIKSISLEITGIYEYSVFMLRLCDGDIDLMEKDSQTDIKIKKFNNILNGKIPRYAPMTPKQRIKRMLLKAEKFFTDLINIQPDMDTFTYNKQVYVVEFNVPDECYMEHSSCDTETRTYRVRARMCNIPDKYIEESKDDESSDDESSDDESNESGDDAEQNENYTSRINGRGRNVRRRIV